VSKSSRSLAAVGVVVIVTEQMSSLRTLSVPTFADAAEAARKPADAATEHGVDCRLERCVHEPRVAGKHLPVDPEDSDYCRYRDASRVGARF
jgi:hypothetical protein